MKNAKLTPTKRNFKPVLIDTAKVSDYNIDEIVRDITAKPWTKPLTSETWKRTGDYVEYCHIRGYALNTVLKKQEVASKGGITIALKAVGTNDMKEVKQFLRSIFVPKRGSHFGKLKYTSAYICKTGESIYLVPSNYHDNVDSLERLILETAQKGSVMCVIGIARCSELDNYSKKFGRKVALDRLNNVQNGYQ